MLVCALLKKKKHTRHSMRHTPTAHTQGMGGIAPYVGALPAADTAAAAEEAAAAHRPTTQQIDRPSEHHPPPPKLSVASVAPSVLPLISMPRSLDRTVMGSLGWARCWWCHRWQYNMYIPFEPNRPLCHMDEETGQHCPGVFPALTCCCTRTGLISPMLASCGEAD